MTKLYTDYAALYQKMYPSFIDYQAEYEFYKNLVNQNNAKTVLEIGCGTGQLAKRFLSDGYQYSGIDISAEMLQYATADLGQDHFYKMDMRSMTFSTPFDAILITARSVSYLVSNADVMATFQSIKKISHNNSVLIFDFIDAKRFIPQIQEDENVVHEVVVDNVSYKRESCFKRKINKNWNWTWTSVFYRKEKGKYRKIGTDVATLRAFTMDELSIFLSLNGFDIVEALDRKVYAFDTLVVVARYRS